MHSLASLVVDDAMAAYNATSLRMHVHQHMFTVDTPLCHATKTRRQ
jgi:hypothetical protein